MKVAGVSKTDDKMQIDAAESIEHISHGAGTSRYGNFHNYYEFNPPSKRLSLLGSDWLLPLASRRSLTTIDIGCNSGDLTIEIHRQLGQLNRPLRTLGVDIDPVLIQRARSLVTQCSDFNSEIEFHTVDVMRDDEHRTLHIEKFPTDGHFDLGLCFAVTMWVHLNHGDDGLRQFLRYISSRCDFLLIEPQTWKCYRNASRRMRRQNIAMFQNIDQLLWRSDVVERIDEFIRTDCHMTIERYFGITEWGRPLTLYRKCPSEAQVDRET